MTSLVLPTEEMVVRTRINGSPSIVRQNAYFKFYFFGAKGFNNDFRSILKNQYAF